MTRIINIMPMAGLGSRFYESDFNLPKPLIKINKKPMFIQAAKSMPKADLNIFICNKKLVYEYQIDKILSKEYKNKFKIITVKTVTSGQANTCLLAEKFLRKNDKIFIHSCDSLIKFKSKELDENLDKFDAIILTTKPNKTHLNNIKSYGWVNYKNNQIIKISCKSKASNDSKNDFVIIGSFAFKNKNTFLELIKKLIKSKKKINNEYYLDMAFKVGLSNNYKIKNMKVESYSSWGTPKELSMWKRKFEKK